MIEVQSEIPNLDRILRPVMELAAKHLTIPGHLGLIKVSKQSQINSGSCGMAHQFGSGKLLRRSWIDIQINVDYPRPYLEDRYPGAVPPFLVRDLQEELAIILGHEIRHIQQFWSDDWIDDPKFNETYESDAELQGYKFLMLWRKWRDKQCQRAA